MLRKYAFSPARSPRSFCRSRRLRRKPRSNGRMSTRRRNRSTPESVWAAEEIAKRTEGRYKIDVFPASQLGKESDINQGLTLGTVDIIISGSSFAAREYHADRRHLFPLHLP